MGTQLLTKLGTLRQLETFIKVAELGSIARASEKLFLTQPGVSIQIKKLADALDAPLYEVIGKKIFLTEAGDEVVKAGQDIFETIHHLNERLNNLKGLESGTLRIAVVTTAKYFLPHILGPFCRQYPGIELEFKVGNRAQIIQRLNNNLDDIYFFSDPPMDLNVKKYEFLPNPIAVIASKDHPLAKRKRLTWKDIENETFLMRESGSGTDNVIQEYLKRNDFHIKRRMIIESNEAIKYSVIANMGISMLSAYALSRGKEEGLVQLPVAKFPILSNWYIVHLSEKKMSIVADKFLEYVQIKGPTLLPMKKISAQITKVLSTKS